jgi:hypothetical protein
VCRILCKRSRSAPRQYGVAVTRLEPGASRRRYGPSAEPALSRTLSAARWALGFCDDARPDPDALIGRSRRPLASSSARRVSSGECDQRTRVSALTLRRSGAGDRYFAEQSRASGRIDARCPRGSNRSSAALAAGPDPRHRIVAEPIVRDVPRKCESDHPWRGVAWRGVALGTRTVERPTDVANSLRRSLSMWR